MHGGIEWLVDARACSPVRLADRACVTALLDRIVDAMGLRVVSTSVHVFPEPGGVTAMYLLAESHLTIHTFPEAGLATLNVYCCRPRTPPAWDELLAESIGAGAVNVRKHARGEP
jgi:S-adenosylmethionine decarboxylase